MGRIVCSWYTPDYAPWADALRASCKRHHEEHDIRLVERLGAEWAPETRRKAGMAAHFLNRHGVDDTIVLVDADCVLLESLSRLDETCRADVSLYARPKMRVRNHMIFRSGTMVLRNNPRVLEFLKDWEFISRQAEKTSTDQDALVDAMCNFPDVTFQLLHHRYCATRKDIDKGEISEDAVAILHTSASVVVGKKEGSISKLSRKILRLARGEAA